MLIPPQLSIILAGFLGVLLLQISTVQGKAKCLNSNKPYDLGKPAMEYLSANNYGKKTLKWAKAATASRVILGSTENEEACPIGVDAVNSSIIELPATTCSAVISTHIGDYIAYCAQEPASKILSYELNCNRGYFGSVIGNLPLITETIHPVFHLEPVDDMISTERPRQLVIALSHNAFSSAFEVLTENNYFSLSPCRHIFEYKNLVAVSTLPIYNIGTIIAFANNNLENNVAHNQKLAPVYIARSGEIHFCGLADVEHTTDVTLWYRNDRMMITYIQKSPESRRCVLKNFEIVFDEHNLCRDVIPWAQQPSIGNAVYNGTTCPVAEATEVFTLDNFLCGCEAVRAVQNESLTYLVVGLANTAPAQDGSLSCEEDERISFNGSATDNICACKYAQNVSFVLPYNKTTNTFNFNDYYDPSTFQLLDNGPAEVTEITPLLLKDCCLSFQVASDRNDTRLYTVDLTEVNGVEKPRVDYFVNVDLPPYVEKTSWGYCSDDTIFMSYTREGFVTGNSIFKLQCKMDDFVDYSFLRAPYSYRAGGTAPGYGNGNYNSQPGLADVPKEYGGQNSLAPNYKGAPNNYVPMGVEPRNNYIQPPQANANYRNESRRFFDDNEDSSAKQLNTVYAAASVSPPAPPQAPQAPQPPTSQYGGGQGRAYPGPQYNAPSPLYSAPNAFNAPVQRYQGPPNPNVPQPLPGASMMNPSNRTGPVYGGGKRK